MHKALMKALAPAAILTAGIILVHGTREQVSVPLRGDIDGVMASMQGYRVQEQVVSKEEQEVAGMSDYVARIYWQDSTLAFTTYVGYYAQQAQGKSIHSPRNCLPGAGWEILRTGTATIMAATGAQTVNNYVLKNGPTEAVVYYWYQGRGRVVANEYAVKWNLLRDAALMGHTEEALVRVVIPVQPGDTEYAAANALGSRMATELMSQVDHILPPAPGSPIGVTALRSVD